MLRLQDVLADIEVVDDKIVGSPAAMEAIEQMASDDGMSIEEFLTACVKLLAKILDDIPPSGHEMPTPDKPASDEPPLQQRAVSA